jgi:hypothetical protein
MLSNVELPGAEKLIVKLYMTERSEQKASPIIMICCCDKATRKEAFEKVGFLIREETLDRAQLGSLWKPMPNIINEIPDASQSLYRLNSLLHESYLLW